MKETICNYNRDSQLKVKLEFFTAVAMKNAVFWDVMSCDCCKNRRFGGKCRLHHQGDKNWRAKNSVSSLRSVLLLLVTANAVPSSPILVTMMMEAIRLSEMSVLARTAWRNSPENGIIPSVHVLITANEAVTTYGNTGGRIHGLYVEN
jgi:hypothetical protein